jgi:hypothetical protein
MESTPRFPQSLEIAARFPHSTQARRRSGWKSGKPKAGFPLSHRTILSLFKTEKSVLGFQPRASDSKTFAPSGKIIVPEWKNT